LVIINVHLFALKAIKELQVYGLGQHYILLISSHHQYIRIPNCTPVQVSKLAIFSFNLYHDDATQAVEGGREEEAKKKNSEQEKQEDESKRGQILFVYLFVTYLTTLSVA
jgi:hypothetical protein